MPNTYFAAMPSVKLRGALAQDIPALYAGIAAAATGGNPTAQVGLAAINGVAATYMRSDGAPALNVGISPTWTGNHTFQQTSGTAVTIAVGTHIGAILAYSTAGNQINALTIQQGAQSQWIFYQPASQTGLILNNGVGGNVVVFNQAGSVTFGSIIGVSGNAPPAQSTGWGTPTGGSVQNNFAGGAATLGTLGAAVAQIITVLKAIGFLGA